MPESNQAEVFKKIDEGIKDNKLVITLHPTTGTKKINSLSEFERFYTDEITFWNSLKNAQSSYQHQTLDGIKNYHNNYWNQYIQKKDSVLSPSNIKEDIKIKSIIDTIKQIITDYNQHPLQVLYSKSKEAIFIKDQANSNLMIAEGILSFFFNKPIPHNLMNDFFFLKGFNIGFLQREGDELVSKYSKNAKNFVDTEYARLTNEVDKIKEKYEDTILILENEKNLKSIELNTYTGEEKQKIIDLVKHIEEKSSAMEKTYNEKLKLEAPAQYWKKYADNNQKKSIMWFLSSMVLTGVIILFVFLAFNGILFFKFYPSFPTNINDAQNIVKLIVSFENIKGAIVFALIISLLVYLLRLTVKFTISARHLMIDANERFTLTYFYLALTSQTNIDKEEKIIALQSLFSRADSGLFKEEHGANMPESISNVIAKLLGK